MLEGLEISEIKLSELEFSKRLDAEYYQKLLLKYENQIRQNSNYIELAQDAKFLIGPFGSAFNTENYVQDGQYRYVRGQDVKPFQLKDQDARFLPKEDYFRLEKYALKQNDILISVVGSLGNACIVNENDLPAIFSCKSTVVRTNNINPNFLLAFLNSKYGRELLLRKERGAIQKGLNLEDLKTILVPNFAITFQKIIESFLLKANSSIQNSKQTYIQAETILLKEIGLLDFHPSKEPINIKSFKESFGVTKRLDAEYYQKKYENYLGLIQNYQNGYEKLISACNLKDNNFGPSENVMYKYIELSNIGKSGEVNGCTEELGRDLPSRARRLVNTGDVVISSIEGSLQSCAVVSKRYNNALCSTGFYIIKSEKINSETLLVLFKSDPMQAIMKQNCSGTILTGMNKDEFKNIPIPIIDFKKQEQIAELVEESFQLKTESERLLEVAKKAVEIAIEENEEAALEFIRNQTHG